MAFLQAGLPTDLERPALKSTLIVDAYSITETPMQSSKNVSVWVMSESVSLCRCTASLRAPRVNEYIAIFVVYVSHVHSIKTKPSKKLPVNNTPSNALYRHDNST